MSDPTYQDYAPNQFAADDDGELTAAEAASACGPALAIGFAKYYGRYPTWREVVDLARKRNLWSAETGMYGMEAELRLMRELGDSLGIDFGERLGGRDWNEIRAAAAAGQPVGVSNRAHYFMISGYDANTDKFYVGETGKVYKGGGAWMSAEEIESRGQVYGALYVDAPGGLAPAPVQSFADKIRAASPEIGQYVDMAIQVANDIGIDPDLWVRQIYQESKFNPTAVSSAGAKGLSQLMPDTARGLGVVNPFDPMENLKAGARFYKSMLDMFEGDERLALAAYNAGPGNVQKYGGVPPFEETQRYLDAILEGVTPPVVDAVVEAAKFAGGVVSPPTRPFVAPLPGTGSSFDSKLPASTGGIPLVSRSMQEARGYDAPLVTPATIDIPLFGKVGVPFASVPIPVNPMLARARNWQPRQFPGIRDPFLEDQDDEARLEELRDSLSRVFRRRR